MSGKKKLIIVVSVIVILLAVAILLIFYSGIKNENLTPDTPLSGRNPDFSVAVPPEQQPTNIQRRIEEKQFKVVVPSGWNIQRNECFEEGCSNISLKKDGFIINISTNALFTGGGLPGDPFAGACSSNYSTVVPITSKIGRIDFTAKSDCVSKIIPGVSTPEVVDIWIGSTIVNYTGNPDFDPIDTMFSISPTLFNENYIRNDNGNYIVVTYYYESNLPFSELPEENQKPLRLDSPELQTVLKEMDEILKTFYLIP